MFGSKQRVGASLSHEAGDNVRLKKRMTIRLNKSKPKLPANFLEDSWKALSGAVSAIHNTETVKNSREELYSMVEGLCMHKLASELCKRLKALLDQHIQKMLALLQGQTPDHSAFLELITNTWQKHCQEMHIIRNLFLYLDRSYVIKDPSLRSLWDMGLSLFRKYLQANPDIESKIINGFLFIIKQERQGETINISTCKSIMRMLVALDLYEEKFQDLFLKETSLFFNEESARMLNTSQVGDYLQYVDKRLLQEKQRIVRYLDPSTRTPLVSNVEKELISVHVSYLLDKGFNTLMDDIRINELSIMYNQFSRVDALKKMKQTLSIYTKRFGTQIVSNTHESSKKEMVPQLLKFKKDMDRILCEAFRKDEDFDRSVRDAFDSFINSRENRPAELMARYVDFQLRHGAKKSWKRK